MRKETELEVRKYMYSFALSVLLSRKSLVEQYFKDADVKYPFHTLFFPIGAIVVSKLERSITAAIGTTFYTHLAGILAKERYSDVHPTGFKVSGKVDRGSLRKADEILEELDRGERKPEAEEEMAEIIEAADNTMVETSITADFYIGDFKEGPLMAEFKTPWPKKEDCIRSKRRLLVFKLLHAGHPHTAFIAFPYNPFSSREKFWWTARRVFDMEKEVKMADEVWDLLGGSGTYKRLVRLTREVGEEVRNKVGLFKDLTG